MLDFSALFDTQVADAPATPSLLPLHVQGLRLGFDGTAVLDGLDLTLGARGCTAIMGANGAGKSLLLKLLHGLHLPDAGRIDWAGQAAAEATRKQALVFQKPVLLRRSVAANLDFVLRARRKPRQRRGELLELVGLSHKARQPARRLSGGEAQRLALARALATEPEVLFLDEPTASLDPASVIAFEDILTRIRAHGTRLILVTHDLGQARRLADDVVFLHRGRVAEHSAAETFFQSPSSAAARAYLDGRIVI